MPVLSRGLPWHKRLRRWLLCHLNGRVICSEPVPVGAQGLSPVVAAAFWAAQLSATGAHRSIRSMRSTLQTGLPHCSIWPEAVWAGLGVSLFNKQAYVFCPPVLSREAASVQKAEHKLVCCWAERECVLSRFLWGRRVYRLLHLGLCKGCWVPRPVRGVSAPPNISKAARALLVYLLF